MMTLTEMLMSFYPDAKIEGQFNSLELDSRKVQKGGIFVAVKGNHADGWDYVASAIESGAKIILTDSEKWQEISGVQVIFDANIKNRLSKLAGACFGWPTKKLDIIGVTGTNGKTSVGLFVSQMLTQMGYPCGYIGTNGSGLMGEIQPLSNTTPDIIDLNRILAEMVLNGAEYCAMEVSSHGLDQGRVAGLEFASTAFTNLSRDHLDYHKTMEDYAQAKESLFLDHFSKTSVINIDDLLGQDLIRKMANKPAVYSCSTKNPGADITGLNIQYSTSGMTFELSTPWGSDRVSVPLFGAFNVENLLLAVGSIVSLGVEFSAVCNQLKNLKPVTGRMEFVSNPLNKAIVVDYAHTPDALEKALIAIRAHCTGNVWVVFGCGGDRDKGKRPLMASIADEYGDYIVVTDDNPRTESSSAIMADIADGFGDPKASHIFFKSNRFDAIAWAMAKSEAGDAILIAGKGHEEYQIVGNQTLDFSDQATVRQIMEAEL